MTDNNSLPARIQDLSGQRFGRLTIACYAGKNRHDQVLWQCRCDCGRESIVVGGKLRGGYTRSCGCLHQQPSIHSDFQDLTGATIGRLTVIRLLGIGKCGRMWECLCSCGAVVQVPGKSLRLAHSRSCGCLKQEMSRQRCQEKDTWTQEMKDELQRRYPGEGAKPLAKKFGLSIGQVIQKAHRMGLRSYNHPMHKAIAAIPRGRRQAALNQSVNWQYFETWTPNMAYILGYIWADGCVRDGHVRFGCVTEDEEILHAIKAELSSKHKITRHASGSGGQSSRGRPFSRFVVSSTLLANSLRDRHGVLPNKTYLDLPFPEVPDQFLSHFARGNLDGDGTVARAGNGKRTRVSFIGQHRFMFGLQKSICKLTGLSPGRVSIRGDILASFGWSRLTDLEVLYKLIYPPGEYIYLARKRLTLEAGLASGVRRYGRMPKEITPADLLALFGRLKSWELVAKELHVSVPCVHLHRKRLGLL